MEKITTCLWFDDQAEAAANFYLSLFKDDEKAGSFSVGAGGARTAVQA